MVPRPLQPRAPAAARSSGLPGVLGPPPPAPTPPGLSPLLLAPPPLLLLLLLLLLMNTPAAPCPFQCYCLGSPETIRCRHIVLQELPRDLPTDAHNLSIVGSNLTVLRAAAFAGEELPTAPGNGSGDGGGWAVRLANLTSLLLNQDNIQVVENGAFWGLPRLATLDLSYNPLSALGSAAFHLLPALSVLKLNAATSGLGEQLDAALRGLATLRHLELKANELTHLPPSALKLTQLEQLDAQDNALTGLALVELRALGGETQGTPTAPTAPGPRVLRLCLANNPLRCDCGARALLTLLNKALWRVPDARSLRCAAPPALQGAPFLVLDESKLSCALGPQEKEEENEKGQGRGKEEEEAAGNEEEGTEGRDEKGQPGTGEELEASYVFFGIVLALIGVVFLMVLYLNRRGIKRWTRNLREACRDQMEGYHYRYEQDADPRRSGTASSSGTL